MSDDPTPADFRNLIREAHAKGLGVSEFTIKTGLGTVTRTIREWLAEGVVTGYEHVKCEAFLYGGPGHQSRHTCEYEFPHPIDGEHHDSYGYDWTGTAVIVDGKLTNNPRPE